MPFSIVWPDNPYEFLAIQEFGELRGDTFQQAMTGLVIPSQCRGAADEYIAKLKELPKKEIKERVQSILDRNLEREISAAKDADELRFFSQPHANANFKEWLSMERWTLSESNSLSFGKCPKIVNPESLDRFKHSSFFVHHYAKRGTLMLKSGLYRSETKEALRPYQIALW
ncbi:MAG: hypothetical protein AAFX02_11765, partial [Pseudomonadota bacterium]